MDNDLKLPLIQGQKDELLFPIKHLPIEQLLEFMEFNLENIIHLDQVRKNKKQFSVNLPFVIK